MAEETRKVVIVPVPENMEGEFVHNQTNVVEDMVAAERMMSGRAVSMQSVAAGRRAVARRQLPFDQALGRALTVQSRKFAVYARNGFTLGEIVAFVIGCMDAFVTIAKLYTAIPENQKMMQCIAAVKQIYMSKNPDIPFLPDMFELLIENMFFDLFLPEIFKVLIRKEEIVPEEIQALAFE